MILSTHHTQLGRRATVRPDTVILHDRCLAIRTSKVGTCVFLVFCLGLSHDLGHVVLIKDTRCISDNGKCQLMSCCTLCGGNTNVSELPTQLVSFQVWRKSAIACQQWCDAQTSCLFTVASLFIEVPPKHRTIPECLGVSSCRIPVFSRRKLACVVVPIRSMVG